MVAATGRIRDRLSFYFIHFRLLPLARTPPSERTAASGRRHPHTTGPSGGEGREGRKEKRIRAVHSLFGLVKGSWGRRLIHSSLGYISHDELV